MLSGGDNRHSGRLSQQMKLAPGYAFSPRGNDLFSERIALIRMLTSAVHSSFDQMSARVSPTETLTPYTTGGDDDWKLKRAMGFEIGHLQPLPFRMAKSEYCKTSQMDVRSRFGD